MLRIVEVILIRWTDTARRSGALLLALFLAATLAAGWYAAMNLKVNTDTSQMLDPDLDFQKRATELREAFPEIKNDVIVVMRAPTLDEADAFAADLRARLLARTDSFGAVFAPAAEPFFQENGLLYLDTDELGARLSKLSQASSLIETLVAYPTAGAFLNTLAENDRLAERSELGQDALPAIYAELAAVAEASAKAPEASDSRSVSRPFSWMGALTDTPPPAGGHQRLLYATPVLDFTRLQPARPALGALETEIAAAKAPFGDRIEVFITGDPALRADELTAVTTGIGLSFLLSFIAVGALLMFCYRSFGLTVITLASLVITIVFTSAFAAATIGELNLVSVAFTVLLVGLGLDFAIHLLLHYQERRESGEDVRRALRGAVHEVGPALALAAPTTALGFLAFIPTRFDGIAQLGIIAGAGVIIAFFVSMTFAPAALGAFPRTRSRAFAKASADALRASTPSPRAPGRLERLSGPLAVVIGLFGVASITLVPQVRFDADPMALRDPQSQSVKGFNLLFDDPETVPYRLTHLLGDAEAVRSATDEAKRISLVRGARSLLDFEPDDQEAKLDLIDIAAGTLAFALEAPPGDEPAPDFEAAARDLANRLDEAYPPDAPARRLSAALRVGLGVGGSAAEGFERRFEANLFAYWPALVERLQAQLLAREVTLDDLPEALARRYRTEDGTWRLDITPADDLRDPAALKAFVGALETQFPDVSGGALQSQKAGEIISEAMLQASLIALAVIIVFLWGLLGRLSDVLLMLAPLALAASLTAAASVLFDIPFNYANVIVLPLLMGIGVDSAIHLVMRQRQVAAGESLFGTSTPRAVLFAAMTTVASFGSLMLSPHRGTASMGELLSIAIAFTLICSLVVLPVVFRMTGRQGSAVRTRRSTVKNP